MTDRELLKKYKDGDLEALELLLHRNRGLVFMVAGKYKWVLEKRIDIDRQDLLQACNIGLWQSINQWDPDQWALPTIAIKAMHKEIQSMIWKQERAQEDGYTTEQLSFEAPLTEDEAGCLHDVIKDPKAAEPAKEYHQLDKCRDFFHHFQEMHNPNPGDLEALQAYVFLDWPPKDKTLFRRVREMVTCNQSTANRSFWKSWLDENTSFIRSGAFHYQRGKGSGYADPTANTAIMREGMEKRLARLLRETVTGRRSS